MKILKPLLTLLFFTLPFGQSWADSELKLQKVTEDVYAIVGELGNRTADNLGNNATFGFVVTSEGVVLIDSGGTYQGAQKIDQLIKQVTDKPVVTVINSGGQDHRWLGNGYFKNRGAQIIASEAAVNDQKARTQDQFIGLGNLVGDEGIKGTDAVYADKTFVQQFEFELGDTLFELRHSGQAHTPGDSFIWLPQKKVMFTGDIVQIRYSATTMQNVVTYPVVIAAPNPDLKLLPGMTAEISFLVDQREDVLKIPNAALRFFPDNIQLVQESDKKLLEGGDRSHDEEESQQSEQTLSAAETGLADRPRSVSLLLAKAEALIELGRPSEAVSSYGLALTIDPDNPRALQGLIDTQAQRRKSQRLKRKNKKEL